MNTKPQASTPILSHQAQLLLLALLQRHEVRVPRQQDLRTLAYVTGMASVDEAMSALVELADTVIEVTVGGQQSRGICVEQYEVADDGFTATVTLGPFAQFIQFPQRS